MGRTRARFALFVNLRIRPDLLVRQNARFHPGQLAPVNFIFVLAFGEIVKRAGIETLPVHHRDHRHRPRARRRLHRHRRVLDVTGRRLHARRPKTHLARLLKIGSVDRNWRVNLAARRVDPRNLGHFNHRRTLTLAVLARARLRRFHAIGTRQKRRAVRIAFGHRVITLRNLHLTLPILARTALRKFLAICTRQKCRAGIIAFGYRVITLRRLLLACPILARTGPRKFLAICTCQKRRAGFIAFGSRVVAFGGVLTFVIDACACLSVLNSSRHVAGEQGRAVRIAPRGRVAASVVVARIRTRAERQT